jgi:hypothetical protein
VFHSKEQQACKRNTKHAKGTTIVLFKGTVGTQNEQQLFHSKEQQARKRNNNCSIQMNNKRTKGTSSAQKEQQLFCSKEQQTRKMNNKRAKGTTIGPFKGTTGAQKEQQLFHSNHLNCDGVVGGVRVPPSSISMSATVTGQGTGYEDEPLAHRWNNQHLFYFTLI